MLRSLLLSTLLATAPALAADPHGLFADYLVGHVAANTGDYPTAAREFAAVPSQDPSNQRALIEGFEVTALSGGGDTLRLAKLLPKNPLAIMVVANADVTAGAWNEAAAAYASLPEAGPFALMRPVLIAWCNAGAGRNLEAIQDLRQAAATSPLSGLYLLHAALIADLAHRDADAAVLYRAAQAQMAQASLRFVLAEASYLARNGQTATARGMLTDLLSGVPQDRMTLPRLLETIGKPLVTTPQQGIAEFYDAVGADLETATSAQGAQGSELSRVFLQMAINLRPDLTVARLSAASEDQQAGRDTEALSILAPVPATDPLDPLVSMARATLLDQQGETQEALATLDRLTKTYPSYAEPYEVMGDIDRTRDRNQDAIAAYDQAIARRGHLGAQDWVLLFDRAMAYQNANNWPAAETDLQSALRLSPNQPDLLNFLGYTWADQDRNLPQARNLLERAVKLAPRNGAILDSLGWVEFRQGQVADAVSTLENAVQMLPEDPDVNTHLGYAYDAAGRHLEARYQWQYALSLGPSIQEAAQLKAKLASLEEGTALASKTR